MHESITIPQISRYLTQHKIYFLCLRCICLFLFCSCLAHFLSKRLIMNDNLSSLCLPFFNIFLLKSFLLSMTQQQVEAMCLTSFLLSMSFISFLVLGRNLTSRKFVRSSLDHLDDISVPNNFNPYVCYVHTKKVKMSVLTPVACFANELRSILFDYINHNILLKCTFSIFPPTFLMP